MKAMSKEGDVQEGNIQEGNVHEGNILYFSLQHCKAWKLP